jgi:hypothetical protein
MHARDATADLPERPGVILRDMEILTEVFRYLDMLAIKEGVPPPRLPKLEFLRVRAREIGVAPTASLVVFYELPLGYIQMSGGSRNLIRLIYTPRDLVVDEPSFPDWREKQWTISDFTDGVHVACEAAFSAFYLGLDGDWRTPTDDDLPWLSSEAA